MVFLERGHSLSSTSGSGGIYSVYNFTYNGLGDRVKQAVTLCAGACGFATVTTYTLDLAAGLT